MPAIEFLALRVPPELKRLLERYAEEENKSVNTLSREILEKWFYPCDHVPIHSETPRARRRVNVRNT